MQVFDGICTLVPTHRLGLHRVGSEASSNVLFSCVVGLKSETWASHCVTARFEPSALLLTRFRIWV